MSYRLQRRGLFLPYSSARPCSARTWKSPVSSASWDKPRAEVGRLSSTSFPLTLAFMPDGQQTRGQQLSSLTSEPPRITSVPDLAPGTRLAWAPRGHPSPARPPSSLAPGFPRRPGPPRTSPGPRGGGGRCAVWNVGAWLVGLRRKLDTRGGRSPSPANALADESPCHLLCSLVLRPTTLRLHRHEDEDDHEPPSHGGPAPRPRWPAPPSGPRRTWLRDEPGRDARRSFWNRRKEPAWPAGLGVPRELRLLSGVGVFPLPSCPFSQTRLVNSRQTSRPTAVGVRACACVGVGVRVRVLPPQRREPGRIDRHVLSIRLSEVVWTG